MALIGLVNLTESLLTQNATQRQDALSAPKQTKAAAAGTGVLPAPQDQFTPSAQGTATTEAAGLFTVSQFALFSATADLLLAQTAALPQTNPANTGTAAANANPVATAQASVATHAAAPPATAAPALAANLPTVTAAGTPSVQNQLQALNNRLAALGLDRADIQKVDQVAGLISDFNPAAFINLVYQLEAQVRNGAQQAAANFANTAIAPAAGGNTAPANNNGQTPQVQAPQQAANVSALTGGAPALAQTRAATA